MNLSTFKNQWIPVCAEKKISARPQRFILLGEPIFLLRQNNHIVALQDRCPHRGVPLSAGKFDGKKLQCAYHGWRFNLAGECIEVPGLTKKISLRNKCVPVYLTKIYCGLVFVCFEENEKTLPLYSIPALNNSDYEFHMLQFNFTGEILNVIENALDATHTHFVHAGLLRHDDKRQTIIAKLTVEETRAEVRYENEEKQSGLISSLFERNRGHSIGRFQAPLIAELEYHSRTNISAAFTFFLSPISSLTDHQSFLIISYQKSWSSWLKKMVLIPFFKLALRQDKAMLKKQAQNLECFPNASFISTELDILRTHIERILKHQSRTYKKTLKIKV